MASEPTNGGTVTVGLPENLESWLDERADDLGLEREELFQRLLTSYRMVATAGAEEELGPQRDIEVLERRIDSLERDHREGLDDVRRRVLQLKRMTEEKADADHDHEALHRVEELAEHIEWLADRVEELSATTRELADRDGVSREKFEEFEDKLSRVARAVVALRRASDRDEDGESAADSADEAAASATAPRLDVDAADRLLDLKRLAAREGYETARCEACGESSHVNLLPEPACPACGTPAHDIVERGSLRKKPTLVGAEESDE